MKELADQLKTIVNMKERDLETVDDLEKMANRTQSINYFKDVKKESLLDRMLPNCYTNFNYECKLDLLNTETLFYIFYAIPGTEIQIKVYNELIGRGYLYSKTLKAFVIIKDAIVINNNKRTIEVFNIDEWSRESKDVIFDKDFINGLEKRINVEKI